MYKYLTFILVIIQLVNCQSLEDGNQEMSLDQKKGGFNIKLTKIEDSSEFNTLATDLIRRLKAEFCYTFIVDDLNDQILTSKVFSNLNGFPWFVIKVRESEDLLSPNYKTIKALKEVQSRKCDVFVILIRNGIQVERFLRFGNENQEILNTKSKFLLIHDYRLFAPHMLPVWRRIVNVVFIKEVKEKRGSKFELTTVPFPFQIREFFVEKQIDVWRKGRFRYGRPLFYEKTSDLLGQELKAVVLEHTPGVRKMNDNQFSGLEIEIIQAISSAMNFTLNLFETSETEKWGKLQPNGSWTGLLGEMVAGLTDFALGDLYYTEYHLNLMDLSTPYQIQCLTFITPEFVRGNNSWKTLILPFSPDMWLGVGISLLCVGMVFFMFSSFYSFAITKPNAIKEKPEKVKEEKQEKLPIKERIKNLFKKNENKAKKEVVVKHKKEKKNGTRIKKDVFDDFSNCIFLTYSMLLVVSLPRMPTIWSVRVLTGWYYIYCILVVVAYRASMTAILTNPIPKVTIDSLEQLAQSSLTSGVWGEETKRFFETALDETSQKIGAKIEVVDDANLAIERVLDGQYAYYENIYFLREIRINKESLAENTFHEGLHIMKDCAVQMPISLGIQKNSPLKPQVDKYVGRLIENGLIEKWLKDATSVGHADEKDDMSSSTGYFDLPKMLGGFVALGIGYGIGFLTLLGEIIYFNCVVVKRPDYDKYLRF